MLTNAQIICSEFAGPTLWACLGCRGLALLGLAGPEMKRAIAKGGGWAVCIRTEFSAFVLEGDLVAAAAGIGPDTELQALKGVHG
mmetsp:Transcript_59867/g.154686  ORF Transcript_59867/g.154686 Transcript_59867/m.154686 type:complete len:85 (-) Transcript_59867:135-389(-)